MAVFAPELTGFVSFKKAETFRNVPTLILANCWHAARLQRESAANQLHQAWLAALFRSLQGCQVMV